MPRIIHGLEELQTLVGKRLGTSDWRTVTQADIDAFAAAVGDCQWIHVDPQRAARESPYGTTVAHGFFTLSLSMRLLNETFQIAGVTLVVNYGLNRVRFPEAVRAGSQIRLYVDLQELTPADRGVQIVLRGTYEISGNERPACVFEQVLRLFF